MLSFYKYDYKVDMTNREITETKLSVTKGRITDAAYKVSNVLGNLFSAEVYQNALVHELQKMGSAVEPSANVNVFYDGIVVGQHKADVVVDDNVMLLVRAADDEEKYTKSMFRHLLLTTEQKLGAIVKFGGSRPEIQFVTGKG